MGVTRRSQLVGEAQLRVAQAQRLANESAPAGLVIRQLEAALLQCKAEIESVIGG